MTDRKIIVVQGCSTKSWEDAVRQVVARTSQSVGRIADVDVVHQSAHIEQGAITEFRVTVHVLFELDEDGAPGEP